MNNKRIAAILLFAMLFIALGFLGENLEFYGTMAVAVVMILFWVLELIPLYVTALLPIILFPLSGITSINQVATSYGSPIIFLFLGGFAIAAALEKWKLHKRVAFKILFWSGSSPLSVLAGIIISTVAISMWISNTATALMMLPVVLSIGDIYKKFDSKNAQLFTTAMLIGMAYSASVGGVATIIGTPPNMVLLGLYEKYYSQTIDFAKWLPLGLAFSIMFSFILFWVLKYFFKLSKAPVNEISEYIASENKSLMSLTTPEKRLIFAFLFVVMLWVFKNPINLVLGKVLLTDHITALLGLLILFLIPSGGEHQDTLLNWSDMQRIPWGILLLFGGGLALATQLETVGIVNIVGDFVAVHFSCFGLIILLPVLVLFTILLTEIMSNVALVNVFIPIVFAIAEGLSLSPLKLAVPVTIAASCAFMMPVSTPPNAIIYSSGLFKSSVMFRIGFFLNIIALLIISILGILFEL